MFWQRLGGLDEGHHFLCRVGTASGYGPQSFHAQAKGVFVEKDGVSYAGTHLLIELWQASELDDLDVVERTLRQAAEACQATVLDVRMHHFGPSAGVSGMVLLAESHISIHTWPEHGYAAVDIFMCGGCNPYNAIPVLRRGLKPRMVQLSEQKRGNVP